MSTPDYDIIAEFDCLAVSTSGDSKCSDSNIKNHRKRSGSTLERPLGTVKRTKYCDYFQIMIPTNANSALKRRVQRLNDAIMENQYPLVSYICNHLYYHQYRTAPVAPAVDNGLAHTVD